jgi:hypothetical protein
MPRASDSKWEEHVPLQQAIPVYVTYLTVGATPDGPTFRADPYNRDKVVLERFAEAGDGMADANRPFQIDLSDLVEPAEEKTPAAKPATTAAKVTPKVARPTADTTTKSATVKAATAKAATAKAATAKAPTTKAPPIKTAKQPALRTAAASNSSAAGSKTLQPPAKKKSAAPASSSEKRVIKKH